MPIRSIFALLVLVLWVNSVTAGDKLGHEEAKLWLQRMLESARALNYQGVFVYVQGQDIEVMSIVHSGQKRPSDKQRQHMFALNGTAREVTVSGEEVVCSLPDQQIAFDTSKYKHSRFPISLPQELDGLEENYRFVILGDDRVANRSTRIIGIEPRDALRFGYRLWLDKDTGMVLRSALIDDNGNIREQLIFTEFRVLNTVAQDLLKPKFIDTRNVTVNAARMMTSVAVAEPQWHAERLPAGFEIILQQRYKNKDHAPATEHIVISDGLATVSVFLEKVQSKPLLEGPTQMDAMSAYGVVLDDYQLIAVGEVPMRTVEQIAQAMRQVQ